jgi:predicted subunit of tRNA(5-methylaminomethyl-2-thiouridylate) methyltransferase
MAFVKGQSGNPGGRPKGIKELTELARANSKTAFERIVAMLDSTDERVVLAAAQEILNRGFGKPSQAVDVTHRSAVEDMGEEELDAAIVELRARLAITQNSGSRAAETTVE